MVKAGRVEHLEWPLRSAQKAAITSLVERSSAVSGRPAMSDHLSLDLANDSPGVVACAISTSTGEMVGYGQASPVHQGYLVGTVGAADVHRGLLAALLERTENTPVTWWVFDPDASSEDAASANGLRPGRQLLQMRCPLPLPTAVNRSAAAA
ncbi:MAG TPA: hypothetical protein PKV27_08265, partial [Ilumatobacteraceae bacterium]|nr:hypothetical protein [Ilumatobacteraceae bacterium]